MCSLVSCALFLPLFFGNSVTLSIRLTSLIHLSLSISLPPLFLSCSLTFSLSFRHPLTHSLHHCDRTEQSRRQTAVSGGKGGGAPALPPTCIIHFFFHLPFFLLMSALFLHHHFRLTALAPTGIRIRANQAEK